MTTLLEQTIQVCTLEQTIQVCTNPGHEGQIQQILTAYADVSSSGEANVGSTNLVKHCIPVDQGTVPIQQLPGYSVLRRIAKWRIKYRI